MKLQYDHTGKTPDEILASEISPASTTEEALFRMFNDEDSYIKAVHFILHSDHQSLGFSETSSFTVPREVAALALRKFNEIKGMPNPFGIDDEGSSSKAKKTPFSIFAVAAISGLIFGYLVSVAAFS